MRPPARVSSTDYAALADVRYQIRRFLQRSARAARAAGLAPQQHQLLLALKALPPGLAPTVGALAERLQIQHHSAVGLIDRLAERGLVRRRRHGADRRQVLVALTRRGEAVLRALSVHHVEELRSVGPELSRALAALVRRPRRPRPGAGREKRVRRRGRL